MATAIISIFGHHAYSLLHVLFRSKIATMPLNVAQFGQIIKNQFFEIQNGGNG